MTRWFSFGVVLALLAAGLVLSQRRKVEARVEATALQYLVADTERELTRLPMKYTRISDAQEVEIGNRIAKEFEESAQDDDGKVVEAYLRTVGTRVAAHAHRKLPYTFHYVADSYFINAFALPGGHVYVGAGLLALMENEDELAAVLGHEIEHIDHYHCAERLQTQAALQKIPLGSILYIPVAVFQAGYNKDQEAEADREGTRLAVASGYSPEGAVQVFAEFQKLEEKLRGRRKAATPEAEMTSAAVSVLTGYFESHPPSADRVAQTQALIAQEKWPLGQETPLAVRYVFLAHRAEALVAAGKYDKAIEAASGALKLHPGHPPALEALAKASCATHDFTKAAAAYKELLAKQPARADQVRAFADERAATAMGLKHFDEAGKFAAFSLELQPNNPNSLKLLARVKLELADVDGALEAARQLQKLYPGAASQLLDSVNDAAGQAFESRDYARAALFAGCSIRMDAATQLGIESLLAQAEFAMADFRASADAYRKLVEAYIRDKIALEPSLIEAYADSLGSIAGHAAAAGEFDAALRPAKGVGEDLAAQIKIEETGLLIMAGNDSMARSLAEGPVAFAPEHAARLGWWYYRASKYDAAAQVLYRFLALRPGDAGLQTTLGWVQLEQNEPGEAVQSFRDVPGEDQTSAASGRAGQVIARWRLRHDEETTKSVLGQFDQLTKEAPEWTNSSWVRAIHGPAATQSVQEMYAERQKRIAARKW